jgi:hypothetical protein
MSEKTLTISDVLSQPLGQQTTFMVPRLVFDSDVNINTELIKKGKWSEKNHRKARR